MGVPSRWVQEAPCVSTIVIYLVAGPRAGVLSAPPRFCRDMAQERLRPWRCRGVSSWVSGAVMRPGQSWPETLAEGTP